jgi:hypothetical protein
MGLRRSGFLCLRPAAIIAGIKTARKVPSAKRIGNGE